MRIIHTEKMVNRMEKKPSRPDVANNSRRRWRTTSHGVAGERERAAVMRVCARICVYTIHKRLFLFVRAEGDKAVRDRGASAQYNV